MRAVVLGVVLILAFVLVYPTLHTYLRQEADLRALRAQVAAARERNADLEDELARWDDPAYVQAQARERLSYVMPGETAYRVVDPETVEDPEPATVGDDTSVARAEAELPWYASVWDSLVVAGRTSDDVLDDGAPVADDETSGEKKPGDEKSGEKKSGEKKSGEKKSGEKKSGDEKSGE